MDDAHVSRQRIIAGEGLLLHAESAADFLLTTVVDRVFMTSEIVRPGEDGVAGFARRRIDLVTLVGSSLTVASQ